MPTTAPALRPRLHVLECRQSVMATVMKVKRVLNAIAEAGLDLPSFVDALSYGDSGCTSDGQVQAARTKLLHSAMLPGILDRWFQPYHAGRNKTIGARDTMTAFAFRCVQKTLTAEFEELIPHLTPSEGISEHSLLATSFTELEATNEAMAPHLVSLLRSLATTRDQERRNTVKKPNRVRHYQARSILSAVRLSGDQMIAIIVCMLAYQRSQLQNRFQRLLSLYWVSCGAPSKAIDMLHVTGLAMSAEWTRLAVQHLSEDAMRRVREWVDVHPFAAMHDNINIAYKVESQRVSNKNHFDNGTAMTVIPLPPELGPLFENESRRSEVDAWDDAAERRTLDWLQISRAALDAAPAVYQQHLYRVIRMLLGHPKMALQRTKNESHPMLAPPEPVDLLPSGPGHRTKQMPLGTVHIDEATHEGNARVVEEFRRQTGLTSVHQRLRLAKARTVPYLGDQKTISLLRHLQGMRASDPNGLARGDWMRLLKGWFHEQMALAGQIFWTHRGQISGHGLARDIKKLERIGLSPKSKQTKPYFHHLHELIFHVVEAHVLDCWLKVRGAESLDELASQVLSPDALIAGAREILNKYASSGFVDQMSSRPPEQRDEVFMNSALFMRDALIYVELTEAIRLGDVGRMANLIPTLLFMFAGGGNPHYAIELLEELQLELNVLTAEEKFALRHHCWLANTSGRKDGFLPLDRLQERNIRSIKYVWAAGGPNASWGFLKTISPIIPTLETIAFHVEHIYGTGTRGRRHQAVDRTAELDVLMPTYAAGRGIHTIILGRAAGDKLHEDVIKNGIVALQSGSTLKDWREGREKYIHSAIQVFEGREWDVEDESIAGDSGGAPAPLPAVNPPAAEEESGPEGSEPDSEGEYSVELGVRLFGGTADAGEGDNLEQGSQDEDDEETW